MSFDFTFVRLFGVILLLPLFKVNYALQNMFVRWGRILGIMWGSCMFYYLLVWYLKLYIGVLRVVAFRNTQLDQSIVPYHKGLGKHVRSWCFLLPIIEQYLVQWNYTLQLKQKPLQPALHVEVWLSQLLACSKFLFRHDRNVNN
jgi:hypothetical protein